MNSVQLIGRLTKDINLRQTQSGTSVGRFNLAVDRRFSKEGQQDADFINITMFKADKIAQYLVKGKQVAIEGRIQTGSYEKDGQRVFTTDVIVNNLELLGGKNDGQHQNNSNQGNYNQQANNNLYGGNNAPSNNNPFNNGGNDINVPDSDLPF